MSVSESRIERLRWAGTDEERWYANRLFEKPSTYLRWESFHFRLMKNVAANRTQRGQIIGMRKERLALLRRQALFQHLRENRVCGQEREDIMAAFHASTDASRALVAEHQRFLRANSSLLCTAYLGSAILHDARFDAELERYHGAYMDYFSLYCDWIIANARGQDFPLRNMITQMKSRLTDMQARLLAMPVAADRRRHKRSAWH